MDRKLPRSQRGKCGAESRAEGASCAQGCPRRMGIRCVREAGEGSVFPYFRGSVFLELRVSGFAGVRRKSFYVIWLTWVMWGEAVALASMHRIIYS